MGFSEVTSRRDCNFKSTKDFQIMVHWISEGNRIPSLFEKMGNVESSCYENHLSRFLPEEKTDIDGVFDTLSGSGGLKTGKATGKAVSLAMLKFTEDVITSVVHVLSYRNLLKGWNLEKTQDPTSGVKALASQLLSELTLEDGKKLSGPPLMDAMCDQSTIANWVFQVPQISTFLSVIIRQGLLVLHSLPDQANNIVNLVPKCKGIKGSGFVSLLDIPSIIYINSHLPSERQHKWRLLFSSRVHGESFSQLCGQIINKGPCILVLKDLDGYIFGGFASESWEVKPQFQGDNRCFLFSISPSLMVHTYTGYNDHFMYLNHGQQTIPNGLGMGGQHDYFGLWIDGNYGKGHSKAKPRCTTYNSPQLSANENFMLDAMEVWAVGDLPESAVIRVRRASWIQTPRLRPC
ncbi:MTOR-associated protein MEAK7 isoform X3 [Dermochelys coriacea]|uniref:MTOR-associated protein MEAK7 isoform X3 n=1 Tax=Dermochelys coriacea TaxID=27794 RepID=UPI001CA7C996|nr:MTOR-associated protein MEAK7 isoform X3 [Dermochelys coriacea]